MDASRHNVGPPPGRPRTFPNGMRRLHSTRPLRDAPAVTFGEQLCLACGLCCDGTLFDNVRLGPDDAASTLKSLGLPITQSRARTPITFFPQPCSALGADRRCACYGDRPGQCRSFECGVFKATAAGRLEPAKALRLVKKARRQADNIRRLLRELGDVDEHRSLGDRFRRTQRRLESGHVTPAAAHLYAELGLAVHEFDLLKHEKFYTRADAP